MTEMERMRAFQRRKREYDEMEFANPGANEFELPVILRARHSNVEVLLDLANDINDILMHYQEQYGVRMNNWPIQKVRALHSQSARVYNELEGE